MQKTDLQNRTELRDCHLLIVAAYFDWGVFGNIFPYAVYKVLFPTPVVSLDGR